MFLALNFTLYEQMSLFKIQVITEIVLCLLKMLCYITFALHLITLKTSLKKQKKDTGSLSSLSHCLQQWKGDLDAWRPVDYLDQQRKDGLVDLLYFQGTQWPPEKLGDHTPRTPHPHISTKVLMDVSSPFVSTDESELTVIEELFLIFWMSDEKC